MSDLPRSNIELKARLADLESARAVAEEVAGPPVEVMSQVDTYFGCAAGRLKLREINDERAELIWYERPDQRASKQSRFFLYPVDDPPLLKSLLRAAGGVLAVVSKRRELFLHQHVRIHLDDVERLGAFLEFEAVLKDANEEVESSLRLLEDLSRRFSISADDLIEGSYRELIQALGAPR